MTGNILLNYLYRDGSNYKRTGQVVFANPDGLKAEEIKSVLVPMLSDGEWFIAEDVDLEALNPALQDWESEDHCWHELLELSATDKEPDDVLRRSIADFILVFENAAQQGWQHYNNW